MAMVSPIALRNSGRWPQPAGGNSCATTTEANLPTPWTKSPLRKPKC